MPWQKGIPQQINFVLAWLTILLVAIGVLSTIFRYRRMVSTAHSGYSQPNFLQSKIDTEFFVLSLACGALLALSSILPMLLQYYSSDRLYFQMMVVLSPFLVIGGITIAQFLKSRPQWIILAILIPYFMCTTGTMYQLFDFPKAATLNSEGEVYDLYYVHEQESAAVKWLRDNGEVPETVIYTGWGGVFKLITQAGITENVDMWALGAQARRMGEGYIYLTYFNMTRGRMMLRTNEYHDTAEFQDEMLIRNRIYASSGSEIYR